MGRHKDYAVDPEELEEKESYGVFEYNGHKIDLDTGKHTPPYKQADLKMSLENWCKTLTGETKCGDCGSKRHSACLKNNCKNGQDCFVPGFGYPPRRGKIIKYDMTTSKKKGVKHNQHKLPMSKLFKQFPRALQAVILTSCYGHNKYKEADQDWMNFSRVEGGSESYWDADIRHQLDREVYGEEDESKLPHIFHEAFDKLAKCELWIQENNIDIKKLANEYLTKLEK